MTLTQAFEEACARASGRDIAQVSAGRWRKSSSAPDREFQAYPDDIAALLVKHFGLDSEA